MFLDLSDIFFWSHSEFFFECTEQVIVVSESADFVNLDHRVAFFQQPFTKIQFGFDDVAVDSHPGLPFEFPADVVFTDVKFLLQPVKGDFFVQMMLDENENIIERKAGAHFCVCLEFCTDAGAQDKHDQHCENAVFKESVAEICLFLRESQELFG